jgi:hypothetical protein
MLPAAGLEVGEIFGFFSTNHSSHNKISIPALPGFNAGMIFLKSCHFTGRPPVAFFSNRVDGYPPGQWLNLERFKKVIACARNEDFWLLASGADHRPLAKEHPSVVGL